MSELPTLSYADNLLIVHKKSPYRVTLFLLTKSGLSETSLIARKKNEMKVSRKVCVEKELAWPVVYRWKACPSGS